MQYSLLERDEMKKVDRFFYEMGKLKSEVRDYRAERKALATDSADPTARSAVEGLADIPYLMGYEHPEKWLEAAHATWAHFRHTPLGKVMERRYIKNEMWLDTAYESWISENTYFRWHRYFLLFAAIQLMRRGIRFNFLPPRKFVPRT